MSGGAFERARKQNTRFGGRGDASHTYMPNRANASQQKCLPCKKMICTGICTYRNRCHYIHDVRIMAHGAKGTCRKKNKEEKVEQKDLFFWPPLATEARNYSVGTSSQSISTTGQLCGSDAVASLWHHFVEVCVKSSNKTDFQEPGEAILINPVSGRTRLSVFVDLAASKDMHCPLKISCEKHPQQQQQQQQQPQQRANYVRGTQSVFSTPPRTVQKTLGMSQPENRRYKVSTSSQLEKYMPVIRNLAESSQCGKVHSPREWMATSPTSVRDLSSYC